jgi:hypothetical protein
MSGEASALRVVSAPKFVVGLTEYTYASATGAKVKLPPAPGVCVCEGVADAVGVEVLVNVAVGEEVSVNVCEGVTVAVGVGVFVRVDVGC